MKKILLFFSFFLLTISSYGTHIVGGELFMINKGGYNYNIGLNLYFDDIHGNPSILTDENKIVVNIYRQGDNQLMDIFEINELKNSLISYNNPACSRGNDLRTRLLFYSGNFYLDPNKYNAPEGYYIVWQRCCRNGGISNLQDPGGQGNTFYLEFPAVISSGNKVTNSSPNFSEIKGDYACINQLFNFDFSATDADGDELRYYLTTPFQGGDRNNPGGVTTTGTLININQPLPYSLINWAPGYNLNTVIPGSSPSQKMKIDLHSGLLSFTANKLGLFVFAVKCEEWRNGFKIGEVHRDFQIEVLDCQINNPPSGLIKDNSNTKVVNNGLIRVKVKDSRCFNIVLSDDFTYTNQTLSNLKVKILKTNFDLSLVNLNPTSGIVSINSDSLNSKLCWRDCALNPPGQPFQAVLVVTDDGCPFPKTDTIRAQFDFDPKPFDTAKVSTNLPGDTATVIAGNNISFNVSGSDPGKDSISIEAVGRGFNLADVGMNFKPVSGTDNLSTTFQWNPDCSVTINKDYIVDFTLKQKRCGNIYSTTTTSHLLFKPRVSTPPKISILDLPGNNTVKFIGDSIIFTVEGLNKDQFPIIIHAIPHDFTFKDAGMVFQSPVSGVAKLDVPFYWKITCDNLNMVKNNNFIIDFVIENNSCQPNRFDTVSATLQIKDHIANYDIQPYNVFTPNGDDKNEYFTMMDHKTGINLLPVDNCQDQFDRIEIFNRWGKEVFKSNDRNFKWYGENFPASTYYYVIYYKKRKYRGWVGILK